MLSILLPIAAGYITKKGVSLFSRKVTDRVGTNSKLASKSFINKISIKVLGRDIFKKKVSDLNIDEFNTLIKDQHEEFKKIILETSPEFIESDNINQFASEIFETVETKFSSVEESIEGIEGLLIEARREWRSQKDIIGLEWRNMADDLLLQIESFSEEKLSSLFSSMNDNFSIIKSSLRIIEMKIDTQSVEIKKTQNQVKEEGVKSREIFKHYFDRIEKYFQNINTSQFDNPMDSRSLQTNYQSIMNNLIICPNCGNSSSDIDSNEIWICSECSNSYNKDEIGFKSNKLTFTRMIALSVFNLSITIKNSRGDLNFIHSDYIPRKEIEVQFEEYLDSNLDSKSDSNIFLILGEPGVGKTWVAAALGHHYSKALPVFYFSLRKRETEESIKALFLENPDFHDFKSVILKIQETLDHNPLMQILFIFDGFDEIFDEKTQRWFVYQLLEPLHKLKRIFIVISSRRYDWKDNEFVLKEKFWINKAVWKNIYLQRYSDYEYNKIMEPLYKIQPKDVWEKHWGQELKRPFLQAIVGRLAHKGKPKFVDISHPELFINLEHRLQIKKEDHPIIAQFALDNLNNVTKSRDKYKLHRDTISRLLSSGIIKEKKGHSYWFAPLIISGEFEQVYCHYVRFISLHYDQYEFIQAWDSFIESDFIPNRVKTQIKFIIESDTELNSILNTELDYETKSDQEKIISDKLDDVEVTKIISKEIGYLQSIYKTKKILFYKIAQRTGFELNLVTRIIQDLILKEKILGKISGSSPENEQLNLNKEWHVEEIYWKEFMHDFEQKKSVWLSEQEYLRFPSKSEKNERLISEQLALILKLERIHVTWDNTMKKINQDSFITNIRTDVNIFIDYQNQVLKEITSETHKSKIAWETAFNKNSDLFKSIIQDEKSKFEQIESVFLELNEKLILFLKDGVKSVYDLAKLKEFKVRFDSINSQIDKSIINLNSFDGSTIKEVKYEKNNFMENSINKLRKKINYISRLLYNHNNKFMIEEESYRSDIREYADTDVSQFDLETLIILESQINKKIPYISGQLQWDSFGFKTENNQITEISLYNLRLKSLPNEISNLRYLKSINLRKNNFTEIPSVINSLFNLERLYFENNQLNSISNLEKLGNLKLLNLYLNEIETIPKSIENLKQLEYLNLNNNDIRENEADFENLPELRTIDLYGNNLVTLPKGIMSLKKLKKLFISQNKELIISNKIINDLREKSYKIS